MSDKIQGTSQISPVLSILNLGFVCMYLVRTGDTYIAFDTGMRVDAVRRELARLSIDASRVTQVILTHSDRDHVGGLAAFPHARVFLPEGEVAMIDHTTARFFGFVYNKPIGVAYETLGDNQEVSIGGATISCIATPGHTAGHMSYLVDGTILVSGDILGLKDGKVVMDRRYINIDNDRRKESIRRLAGLTGVAYLCTMHHGYTNDFQAAIEGWK